MIVGKNDSVGKNDCVVENGCVDLICFVANLFPEEECVYPSDRVELPSGLVRLFLHFKQR
jgi:hypothetical protein